MAKHTLSPTMRPAKVARATSSISATTASGIDMARQHLRTGNPSAYARLLAGQHRASAARQQDAVEAIIAADACQSLFERHAINGCLMAREG